MGTVRAMRHCHLQLLGCCAGVASLVSALRQREPCSDSWALNACSTRLCIQFPCCRYDGYSPQLSRVLRFHRSYGRHMPK